MRRRGFTLIELLVTLTLLGLIFAVSTVRFTRMFAYGRLKASARGVGDLFTYAISRAYTTGKYNTIVFDLTTGSYWLKLGREEDEEARSILKRNLGKEIRFSEITVGPNSYVPPGTLEVQVSPLGITSDIRLALEDNESRKLTVELDSLVQRIVYHEEEKSGALLGAGK